jgi:hypothetical protein
VFDIWPWQGFRNWCARSTTDITYPDAITRRTRRIFELRHVWYVVWAILVFNNVYPCAGLEAIVSLPASTGAIFCTIHLSFEANCDWVSLNCVPFLFMSIKTFACCINPQNRVDQFLRPALALFTVALPLANPTPRPLVPLDLNIGALRSMSGTMMNRT